MMHLVVTGQTNMGKTTFLRAAVSRYARGPKKIVICDAKEGQDGFGALGYPSYQVSGSYTPGSIDWRRLIDDKRRVRILAKQLTPDEYEALGDDLAQACLDARNVLWVVDEAHRYYGESHNSKGAMVRAWDSGRDDGVDLWFATQMIVRLNIIPRKQANYWVTFALREPNDAGKVAEMIQVPSDRIRALPPHRAIAVDLDRGAVAEITSSNV